MRESGSFSIEVVAPVFAVTDIERAKEHYVDKLLFKISFEWRDDESQPIRYLIVTQGNTELHLTWSEEPRPAIAYFFVDNVQGYYEAVSVKGANITQEIADQPWEMREFETADGDGNRLIFGEHLSRLRAAS